MRAAITARDWRTYPILKMADIPEIKVVLLHKPEVGSYGGGSEAANALAAPAIAAALFDATGKIAAPSVEARVRAGAAQGVGCQATKQPKSRS